MANAPPPPPVDPNEFPIHTDGSLSVQNNKLKLNGVGQINLDDLAKKLKPVLVDPTIPMVESDDVSRPATATSTKGPHRYTVVVPNVGGGDEASVLNVGVGAADKKARIIDAGITGRTKSHIHWHVQATGGPETMVALGGGTKEGFTSFKGIDHLKDNKGFMAVTKGKAWIDATEELYMVTKAGQLVARIETGNARLQADVGDVELAAGHDVAIGAKHHVAIVADSDASINESGYGKKFDKTYWSLVNTKGYKVITTAGDVASAALTLGQSYKKFYKVGDDKKKTWKIKPDAGAKFIVDAVKLVSSTVRLIAGFFDGISGQVKITGSNFASVSAGIAASLFGNLSASVSSPLSASVVGGTAGIKGLAWTSIWAGLGVSMKTLKGKAEVKSDLGEVAISGETDVAISSVTSAVTVTGKTNAVVSADKNAVLHGKTGAYALSGADPGFGLAVTPEIAHIGRFSKTTDFAAPAPKEEHGVWVKKDIITSRFHGTKSEMRKDAMFMESKTVTIRSPDGKIRIKAPKVLIG